MPWLGGGGGQGGGGVFQEEEGFLFWDKWAKNGYHQEDLETKNGFLVVSEGGGVGKSEWWGEEKLCVCVSC